MTADPFAPGISLPNLVGVIPDWVSAPVPCHEDPEMFFSDNQVAKRNAVKICKTRCDFTEQCLAWQLEFEKKWPGSTWGVYGGTTAEQRRTAARRRRHIAAKKRKAGAA